MKKQTIEIEVPDGKQAVWKDDKVVFRDVDIYTKLENPSWYQDQILCRVLIMLLTWATVVCLICSLYYKQ